MPEATLTKGEWKEVQEAAESGMDDDTLEREFGVPKNAIRQRRFRDKKNGKPWKTPKQLEFQQVQEQLEKFYKSKPNGGSEGGLGMNLIPVTQEELTVLREENPKKFARRLGELLLQALPLLKLPTSVQEWTSMHNAYRKALGLDQQAGVNINLHASGMNWGSDLSVN